MMGVQVWMWMWMGLAVGCDTQESMTVDPNLQSIGGDLAIADHPTRHAIPLCTVSDIDGDVVISDNPVSPQRVAQACVQRLAGTDGFSGQSSIQANHTSCQCHVTGNVVSGSGD
jgi:hypothetical protein